MSGRRIETALSAIGVSCASVAGILITHEHQDHINGAGILSRRYGIPVYANALTWKAIEDMKLMGKLPAENKRMIAAGEAFSVGTFSVTAYPVPHDAADPIAYTVSAGGHKIAVATDIGYVTETVKENLFGSELVLIEANHDINMLNAGRYPYPLKRRILGDHGHLSNEAAASLICELAERGTRKFILGHLSGENNYPKLAYETASMDLKLKKGLISGQDVYLTVAFRDRASEIVEL